MSNWSRNEKISIVSLIIAVLAILVALMIPELRKIIGLESHHKLAVQEIKPVPKPQVTPAPSRPPKKPFPPLLKETEKTLTKSEEPIKPEEPKLSSSVSKETEKQPTKHEEPKPMVRRGNIKVSCYVTPRHIISPNETAMIKVFTETSDKSSVFDSTSYAEVIITCPAGTFPSSGTNTLVGRMEMYSVGYFDTLWYPPRDLKGKFSLGVEVKKEGVGTGVGTCEGEVK